MKKKEELFFPVLYEHETFSDSSVRKTWQCKWIKVEQRCWCNYVNFFPWSNKGKQLVIMKGDYSNGKLDRVAVLESMAWTGLEDDY